ILKFAEGLAEMIFKLVKKELKRHPIAWISFPFLWLAIKGLRKRVDYSEFGGAPLLGVDGVCIIGHGMSNGKAVKNAILTGAKTAEHNLAIYVKEAIIKHSNKVV
ncbi:MAG: phosphate--acyl-ACP acyltransferase, partial [Endomicrobium sp.]|nr:phosphate--acyl-ACP acyltransferase [Endomicrobium sp.]